MAKFYRIDEYTKQSIFKELNRKIVILQAQADFWFNAYHNNKWIDNNGKHRSFRRYLNRANKKQYKVNGLIKAKDILIDMFEMEYDFDDKYKF